MEENADLVLDVEQQALTARLAAMSETDPARFHACLQEIEEVLGISEVVKQLELLSIASSSAVDNLLHEELSHGGSKDGAGKIDADNVVDDGASEPQVQWALKIGPHWCNKILYEGKEWEIRGTHCRKHLGERIGLAPSGKNALVGEATIRESRAVSMKDLEEARHLHHIQNVCAIPYAKPYAWILEGVRAYDQPVPYHHPPGCVNWIPLRPPTGPTERETPARRPARCAAPVHAWPQMLERRQSGIVQRPEQQMRYIHGERERIRRLSKKFPAVYKEKVRPEQSWMTQTARAFRTWCATSSWRMCKCCGRMVPEPYKATHARGTARRDGALPACKYCRSDGNVGYWAPDKNDVPRRLRSLPVEVIEALRPFHLHRGGDCRARHGYEVHLDMLRFSFKTTSVEMALSRLPRRARKKGERALEHLLRSDLSSYKAFWRLHHKFLEKRRRQIERGEIGPGAPVKRLPVSFIETVGLECCLWPHLYWRTDMTETHTRFMDARRAKRRRRAGPWESSESDCGGDAEHRRHSAKASFLAKAHSCIVGYNSDPALLQFVHDLWLFTTVGGARHSSQSTSIREALASKPYSPELWRGYHAALVDLQRQLGWPQLFITIAPYEWSFPYHAWLEDELAKSLQARLHMPVAETLHLAHVLTQTVKGLLTGSNEGMQGEQNHVFSTSSHGGVRKWVARLEFQDGKRKRGQHRDPQTYHGRGTLHVHILLWLENMQAMNLSKDIRADIPDASEPELRDLVLESQLDWTSSGWPIRKEPTRVSEDSGLLELRHPQDAHDRHCRAYLTDVLAALHCHVDVVASDGRAMILKYCASPLEAGSCEKERSVRVM